MSMTEYEERLGYAVERLDQFLHFSKYISNLQSNNIPYQLHVMNAISAIAQKFRVNETDLYDYYKAQYLNQ